MTGRRAGSRDWRACAGRCRTLPLASVAALLGYRRDPADPARWKRQGSIISINGARFFDHLRGRGGGGAIDLVMHARACRFQDAVHFLSEIDCPAVQGDRAPERIRPAGPELPARIDHLWPRVRDHLIGERGLDAQRLDDCHRRGLIYADGRMNAVFVAKCGAGITTGAELVGSRRRADGGRFRAMAPGSRKASGSFWLAADRHTPATPASALLVESAIDALSALSLPVGHHISMVVSTSGVQATVPAWMEPFRLERICCGYDADRTGDHAAELLAGSDCRVQRLRPEGAKDWNDMLRQSRDPAATPPSA